MPRRMKNMTRFPYKFNCLCWKIALDIALLDVTSTSRLTLREWPPWCSKLCRCVPSEKKQYDPLVTLFYKVERKICIAIVAAIMLALRSLIKTESRTAKLRQVESHCQGLTGKWMSEWMSQSLVFCSLPFCPFLTSWFFLSKWSAFEKKNPSARLCIVSFHSMLAPKFQGTWTVPFNHPFLRKQTSETALKPNSNISYIFVKLFWISLPINAKKLNLLQHLFLRSIRTFWSSIWSSTVEVPFIFIHLCRFSRVDVPA